jgi:DNA-binding NarL/FixJ family response regulator
VRILIAEDDFTSRSMLAAVLKKSGHEVVETVNGAGAWDALQQPDAPALAILDYWKQVEVYVRDHTEAEFSHGICPECTKKLHRELDQDDEGSAPH